MPGTTRAVHARRAFTERRRGILRDLGVFRNGPSVVRSPSAGRGMMPLMLRPERHPSHRSNWLRAAVLGANDGIVSTASLVLGVAASGAARAAILTAGIAGLVAGALSMAAGEFVSVSSQRDAELADLD